MEPPREDDVRLIAAAGQFESVADVDENLRIVRELATQAADRGAELIVLPEASMYDWNSTPTVLRDIAHAEGSRFFDAIQGIAQKEGLAIVAGGYTDSSEGRPYNRLIVADPNGEMLARYDKVHLYDAFGYRESDSVLPAPIDGAGQGLAVLPYRGFTLGLMNCYDLRFPELARALVEAGADVLLESSAFVAGPYKEMHWETLLRARAIENTSYVVASSQSPSRATGLSMVIDPIGLVASTCVQTQGIAIAELSRARLSEVRRELPLLENRRFNVSPLRPR